MVVAGVGGARAVKRGASIEFGAGNKMAPLWCYERVMLGRLSLLGSWKVWCLIRFRYSY